MKKTREDLAGTLYRSATLAERIRDNRIDENKSTADGMGSRLDYEGARPLIRILPQVERGRRIRERYRARHWSLTISQDCRNGKGGMANHALYISSFNASLLLESLPDVAPSPAKPLPSKSIVEGSGLREISGLSSGMGGISSFVFRWEKGWKRRHRCATIPRKTPRNPKRMEPRFPCFRAGAMGLLHLT